MPLKDLARVPIYFKRLTLENVRCFGKMQSIKFLKPDGTVSFWNIIIGENGVGKTTVLRSLVVEAMPSWLDNIGTLFGFDYFRRDLNHDALIASEFENIFKVGLSERINKKGKVIFSTIEKTDATGYDSRDESENLQAQIPTKIVCFGYGASRHISVSSMTESKSNFRAMTLFNENTPLLNAEEWLVEIDYRATKSENGHYAERQQKVIAILKKLFRGEVHDFKIDLEGKRPKAKFLTDYGWVNLHDLSLGYKTLIAWMTDFASRMFEEYPDSPDPLAEPAVVLVDEIDLHLHPQFQRELTSFLTETFPKTQFIVTAHSPLILQSAPDANIILLKKEGDHVVVEQNPHEIKNWRIDQLLTSDLYGLPSARPPQTEEKIQRRRSLLKKDKRTKKEETELDKLEEELVELPVGETPEAIKAMEIIQKAAKHYEKQQNGKD
ncbi:MAG: AAA family ATPase [Lewinellaceae bacterium]|nr:AAA family ATPase [Saprospiraceae bacterium]MCB9339328.1 AAA family ATPase [Lewinellaceae bacterium]